MGRAYTVATVALALNSTPKWVDNVLSHFTISGVRQGKQGVARRISTRGVLELALVQQLSESLRIPIEIAAAGARALVDEGELTIGASLSLRLETDRELATLESRLEYAVEAAPLPRRGRPPGKAKRGA